MLSFVLIFYRPWVFALESFFLLLPSRREIARKNSGVTVDLSLFFSLAELLIYCNCPFDCEDCSVLDIFCLNYTYYSGFIVVDCCLCMSLLVL